MIRDSVCVFVDSKYAGFICSLQSATQHFIIKVMRNHFEYIVVNQIPIKFKWLVFQRYFEQQKIKPVELGNKK